MTRTSPSALLVLSETIDQRQRDIVETVGALRLVSGSQLERLYFSSTGKAASAGRAARRLLATMSELRLLHRLERRIGGVRAGSAGHVYGLGPVGKRLTAYWQGEGLRGVRTPHEPGPLFVRHTLAMAEQYVRLVETERSGTHELLCFESEPVCWRTFVGGHGRVLTLKPDAFVRLGVGEYEQHSFLEMDCGSEGRGALTRKCQMYVSYYQTGTEQAKSGVFPRVVWLTTNRARVRLLVDVCSSLPAESWQLFGVGTPDRLLALVGGEGDDD